MGRQAGTGRRPNPQNKRARLAEHMACEGLQGSREAINILEPDEQLGGRSSSSRGTKALRRRPLASSKMHLFLMRANRCKASSSPS